MYIYINIYVYVHISVYSIHTCIHICIYIYIFMYMDQFKHINESSSRTTSSHGVATMSRLFKIIGLFCKRAL